MDRTQLSQSPLLLATLACALLAALPGLARGATSYKIEHKFHITLDKMPVTPPTVEWFHTQTALVRNGVLSDAEVNPFTRVPVPSAPFVTTSSASASIPGGSSAEAHSRCSVSTFTTTTVSGYHGVNGYCDEVMGSYDPPSAARSHSWGGVAIYGDVNSASGVIEWEPDVSATDTLSGGCLLGLIDPIVVTRTDLHTMQTEADSLLSIFLNIGPGGRCSWVSGVLDHDAQESFLEVRAASAWSTLNGTLRLVVSGGQVTESVATGDFSGVALPTVGAANPFVIAVPAVIAVPYDVGSVPEDSLEITIELSGGTSEETALVPVGEGAAEVRAVTLSTPHPNPRRSNQTGTFQFRLLEPDRVRLELYDARGRHLGRSQVMEVSVGGRHELRWNPGDLQPGVYWVRLVGRSGPLADTHWIVVR